MEHISQQLKVSVLAVEYPGYGVYSKSNKANKMDEQMKKDASEVMHFLTEKQKIRKEDILIMGRSIGTGPATYLAAESPVHALMLMSPYLSIRRLAKDMVGFLKFMIAERFENYKAIKNVHSPILLLHGEKDSLIKCKHSQELH